MLHLQLLQKNEHVTRTAAPLKNSSYTRLSFFAPFPDDDEKHGWGASDGGGGGGGRSGGGGGGDTNPDRPTPGTGMLTRHEMRLFLG